MNPTFILSSFSSKQDLFFSLIKKKSDKLKQICSQLQIDLETPEYNNNKKNDLIEYIVEKYITQIEKKSLPVQKINIKLNNGDVCSIQGKRVYMEDTYVYSEYDDIKLFGVFDGHSGSEVSDLLPDFISKVLFKRLVNAIRYLPKKVIKMVKKSFLDIDNFLQSHFTGIESGSTACLCLQIKDKFYLINLGDSRAVLFSMDNKKFKILAKTKDHKPDDLKEYKRIIKSGGRVELAEGDVARVDGNLAMSRAFGDFELKYHSGKGFKGPVSVKPDVKLVKTKGKKQLGIIIASDGLWDIFSEKKVLQFFVDHGYQNFCQEIVKESLIGGSTDNITVLMNWL